MWKQDGCHEVIRRQKNCLDAAKDICVKTPPVETGPLRKAPLLGTGLLRKPSCEKDAPSDSATS